MNRDAIGAIPEVVSRVEPMSRFVGGAMSAQEC